MQQVAANTAAPAAPRRDPAPSRWSYRLHRLWLTPLFRLLLRVGLPMGASLALAVWYLGDPATQQQIIDKVAEIRRSVAERPEFMVRLMAIDGASDELGDDIREVLPVDFPVSSFDLELDQMRGVVEELDAVASVDLRIRPDGILQLAVIERIPQIIWRLTEDLELLDAEGRRVAALAHRMHRFDLPLIAGEGADAAVPEALALFAAAAPLEPRLRGLVRMGERRWDVVLDRGQRILLPEQGAVAALEQVIALDQAQDLLARDIAVVDMRNGRRPTLRMGAVAVTELHKIKAIELGENYR
ncbi:MAG: cell division protein FtsQ [Rhodobacteraceae bacterium]|nr:cell division protein FtsQ [Paracoccaceae bacterium]